MTKSRESLLNTSPFPNQCSFCPSSSSITRSCSVIVTPLMIVQLCMSFTLGFTNSANEYQPENKAELVSCIHHHHCMSNKRLVRTHVRSLVTELSLWFTHSLIHSFTHSLIDVCNAGMVCHSSIQSCFSYPLLPHQLHGALHADSIYSFYPSFPWRICRLWL